MAFGPSSKLQKSPKLSTRSRFAKALPFIPALFSRPSSSKQLPDLPSPPPPSPPPPPPPSKSSVNPSAPSSLPSIPPTYSSSPKPTIVVSAMLSTSPPRALDGPLPPLPPPPTADELTIPRRPIPGNLGKPSLPASPAPVAKLGQKAIPVPPREPSPADSMLSILSAYSRSTDGFESRPISDIGDASSKESGDTMMVVVPAQDERGGEDGLHALPIAAMRQPDHLVNPAADAAGQPEDLVSTANTTPATAATAASPPPPVNGTSTHNYENNNNNTSKNNNDINSANQENDRNLLNLQPFLAQALIPNFIDDFPDLNINYNQSYSSSHSHGPASASVPPPHSAQTNIASSSPPFDTLESSAAPANPFFHQPLPLKPPPQTVPFASANGLPGRNIRPTPLPAGPIVGQHHTDTDVENMGHQASKFKQKLRHGRAADSDHDKNDKDGHDGQVKGSKDGRNGADDKDDKDDNKDMGLKENTAAQDGLKDGSSLARLPTPEYLKEDVNTPIVDSLVSPLSPAISPELLPESSETAVEQPPKTSLHPEQPHPARSFPDLRQPDRSRPNREPLPRSPLARDLGNMAWDASARPFAPRMMPPPPHGAGSSSMAASMRPPGQEPGPPPVVYRDLRQEDLPDPDPRALNFPSMNVKPAQPGNVWDAPPLKEPHLRCFVRHRKMDRQGNRSYPVACQACHKADAEDRYRCSFCSLRVCESCFRILNAYQRDLPKLVEHLQRSQQTSS